MVKKRERRTTEAVEKEMSSKPPGIDGRWGWFVVVNSFMCNMIVDGMQYTFGNFLGPIATTFNDASVASVALIASLLSGFYNFSGPVAGALGNKFGFRMVAITGSLVSSSGLMLSYFAPDVHYLYFFYGILGGLGFGMIYMASVITTSVYFERYRALAASLSVCGTGVGTFVFSPLGNFLVQELGWRYALVIEGGFILLCILCGLSFKPMEIIKVIPLSSRPSDLPSASSETAVTRGSLYFPVDPRKTLRNEEYPTFKEALQYQDVNMDDRRSTITTTLPKSRRQSVVESLLNFSHQLPIYSVVNSSTDIHREQPSRRQENKCQKNCRVCCFNCWHCQSRNKDLSLGDRPMYRDDIFYGGSLASLHAYTSSDRVNYHLSVTRVPDVQEIEEHVEQKCCVCHRAVLRTCITMTGLNLLRSRVFIFLCISSFLYTMSLYIPYVFIRKVAEDNNIEKDVSVWLVSTIGISNTAGRLASGIVKSFIRINGAILVFACLVTSGLFSFIFFIKIDLSTLIIYCVIFGFFTAPFISLRPVIIVEFLGLEKLTNAFGLVLLSQGVASIMGPPAAGALDEATGKSIYTIYVAGSLLLISSLSLLMSIVLHRRKRGMTR